MDFQWIILVHLLSFVIVVRTDINYYSFTTICSSAGVKYSLTEHDNFFYEYNALGNLAENPCRISFTEAATDDSYDYDICVRKSLTFDINDCTLKVQFKGGESTKEYSCSTTPTEYCVTSEETLTIDVVHDNVQSNADITLKVYLKEKDKPLSTAIIIILVCVGVFVFIGVTGVAVYVYLRFKSRKWIAAIGPNRQGVTGNQAHILANRGFGFQSANIQPSLNNPPPYPGAQTTQQPYPPSNFYDVRTNQPLPLHSGIN